MALTYTNIFSPVTEFQRAVNLSMDLGNLEYVKKYIPTKASVAIMREYLHGILQPGSNRASILIGPYGKGKSHTVFLVLSLISEDGDEADIIFEGLAKQIEGIDSETADMIRKIRREKIRLVPVVINDRYLDIKQAFMASIKQSLNSLGLDDIMPETYYQSCLATIDRWKEQYPSTYKAYRAYLRNLGIRTEDYENQLRQFDVKALDLFRDIHREILSGAKFEPLLESDIPTIYRQITRELCTKSQYSGLFIVFDEFGKYLESVVNSREHTDFKALQDLAEMCTRSKEQRFIFSCITHKAISEYATHLPQNQQNDFKTVEGRFVPLYFTSTFEGSFSLISGALNKDNLAYQEFVANHQKAYDKTIDECERTSCFSGYSHTIQQIVDLCFPMHPMTALALMRMSERAAQNERTLFTFLAAKDTPLNTLIRRNRGKFDLATVPMVYDYFHESIRENSYDPELRNLVIYCDSLIPQLAPDMAELTKAIVLFSMLGDNCLLATKDVLKIALQWDSERLEDVANSLEKEHRIYTRRSDGVLCMMKSATDTIRTDISNEVAIRHGRVDIADQLAQLIEPGFTIPRRYNDKHELVRYFRNVFVSADQFTRQKNSRFLYEYGFADGYVIYLIGELENSVIQTKLKEWNDDRIIVLSSEVPFEIGHEVEECNAINQLLSKSTDEVVNEELGYYLDDLLQLVNKAFSDLFDGVTSCVTRQEIKTCSNVGAEVSLICEQILYPDTPIIRHEMINRNSISGQMRMSREKVVNAVLYDTDYMHVFEEKSAESAIIYAVLGDIEGEQFKAINEIIFSFIRGCERERQPIMALYKELLKEPYGIRRGVLPILLAHNLRSCVNQVTIYNHLKEMPLDGETLNALDEHVEDYDLLVDCGSADQMEYIAYLQNRFAAEAPTGNLREIHTEMYKLIRALPRAARANNKMLTRNAEIIAVPESYIAVRNTLLKYETNPHDVILDELPKAMGISPSVACAKQIETAIDFFDDYTNKLQNAMIVSSLRILGANKNQSLHGAMITWLQRQGSSKLNRVYDATVTATLNVMRSKDNHSDNEWINMLAIALTNLPVEDWSDQQLINFCDTLKAVVLEVESTPDDDIEASAEDGSFIKLQIEGINVNQSFGTTELEGMSAVAYDSMKSTLAEFAESLSPQEKLLVLANLIARMNED